MPRKKNEDPRVTFMINVPPEHMEALERAAEDSYLTKSAMLRQIVLKWLREHGYLNGASNGRSRDSLHEEEE